MFLTFYVAAEVGAGGTLPTAVLELVGGVEVEAALVLLTAFEFGDCELFICSDNCFTTGSKQDEN